MKQKGKSWYSKYTIGLQLITKEGSNGEPSHWKFTISAVQDVYGAGVLCMFLEKKRTTNDGRLDLPLGKDADDLMETLNIYARGKDGPKGYAPIGTATETHVVLQKEISRKSDGYDCELDSTVAAVAYNATCTMNDLYMAMSGETKEQRVIEHATALTKALKEHAGLNEKTNPSKTIGCSLM